MEKITFGNGLPGYEIGDKSAPALIVIQVRKDNWRAYSWNHLSMCFQKLRGNPAVPSGSAPTQEWWGVNDVVKEIATLLSKDGFRCLVPGVKVWTSYQPRVQSART